MMTQNVNFNMYNNMHSKKQQLRRQTSRVFRRALSKAGTFRYAIIYASHPIVEAKLAVKEKELKDQSNYVIILKKALREVIDQNDTVL